MKNSILKNMALKIVFFFTKWFKKHSVFEEGENFVIIYKNATENDKNAVLLGHNIFGGLENNGTEKDVEVTMVGDLTYEMFLKESAASPINIRNLRISFDISNKTFYSHSPIRKHTEDANGEKTTKTLIPLTEIDLYQFSDQNIDTNRFNGKADGCTYFRFKVKAKSTVAFCLYSLNLKTVNYFEYLKLKKTKPSRINGKNVAPVIISCQYTDSKIKTFFIKIKTFFTKLF